MWLADTHVFLHWMAEPERIPPAVRALLSEEPERIVFSTVSLWEIVVKTGIGKLGGVDPAAVLPAVRAQGWRVLEIKVSHLLRVATLPALHADPFDRLLVAQAIEEGLSLVSGDAQVARYPLKVLWE